MYCPSVRHASHFLLRALRWLPWLCLLAAILPLQPALAHGDNESKIDVVLEGAAGGPNEATFTATAIAAAPGLELQMQWTLPQGVELIGGPVGDRLGQPAHRHSHQPGAPGARAGAGQL